MPPPPVIQSVHRGSTARPERILASESREPTSDNLLVLRRKEEELQATIQELLDAQADGLMAGLREGPDDLPSTGSTTPTMSSFRDRSMSPAQPRLRRRLGLKGARRAIWRSILECAKLKEEEDMLITTELLESRRILKQISGWSSKRDGLNQEIDRREREDTEARLRSLNEEASHLENEIADMELRLTQMRTRHRNLLAEISDLENNLQSELASYRNSLSLLDAEVEKFLARPPIRSHSSPEKSGFTSLPPGRRTLAMAKEHWELDVRSLDKHRRRLRKEHMALEEGAVMWTEVVADIVSFEKELRSEMQKTTILDHQETHHHMGQVLEHMDTLISTVESRFLTADEKGWKLLVVCIGAELEALRHGKDILENALSPGDPASRRAEISHGKDHENSLRLSPDSRHSSLNEPPHRPLYDAEDDEPDPDLILSRQDTDTE